MTTTHQDLAARIRARAEVHRTMPIPSACDKITALELAEVAAALEAASQPPGAVELRFEDGHGDDRDGWYLAKVRERKPIATWQERIQTSNPKSQPEYWPSDLKAGYMAHEIADLRAALSAPSPAQAPVVQGEAPKPLSCTDAIAGWHACTDAHERVTAFEWFSAGILFAERAHGIGVSGAVYTLNNAPQRNPLGDSAAWQRWAESRNAAARESQHAQHDPLGLRSRTEPIVGRTRMVDGLDLLRAADTAQHLADLLRDIHNTAS